MNHNHSVLAYISRVTWYAKYQKTLEVELKIKTKWSKLTLHMDQFTRTENIEHGGKPIGIRYTQKDGNTTWVTPT